MLAPVFVPVPIQDNIRVFLTYRLTGFRNKHICGHFYRIIQEIHISHTYFSCICVSSLFPYIVFTAS